MGTDAQLWNKVDDQLFDCLTNARSRLEAITPMMNLDDGGQIELSREERLGAILALKDTIVDLHGAYSNVLGILRA